MSRWIGVLLLAAVASAWRPPQAHGAEPPSEAASEAVGGAVGDATVDRLIAQLGDPDYTTRESAAARLERLGSQALPAVERAARSLDPEVRVQANRLAVVLRERAEAEKVAAFIRGGVDPAAPTLPGWRAFQAVMQNRGASRRVFADVYRSDRALLEAAFLVDADAKTDGGPDRSIDTPLARLVERRAAAAQGRGKSAGRPSDLKALALQFVAAARPEAVTKRSAQLLTQVARGRVAPLAKRGGEVGRATKAVLTEWTLTTQSEDLYVLSQMLRVADELDLRDAAPLAIGIALGDRKVRPAHPQFRATALLMVGKLGGPGDVPRIAELLDDDAVCASQSGRAGVKAKLLDVQVRDVALAVVLHLTGEQPADYGYPTVVAHSERLYVMHTLAFHDQKARTAALAKWREQGVGEPAVVRIATRPAAPGAGVR